eukprot:COSAG01_NODE_23832_length_803_cov_1.051355_1_plen_57_part_00
MGKNMSDAEFAKAMFEIDADGSGELDFGEFLKWWQKQDKDAQKQLMQLSELNFNLL